MFDVIYCGVLHRGHGQHLDWSMPYGGCGGAVDYPGVVLVRCPEGDFLFHEACAPARVPMFRRGLAAEAAARADRAVPA